MTDSNDWLASIDLDAVRPTGPRRTATVKKPRRRIVYGEPSRLAPTLPKGRGPDQQRTVTPVAGQFIPTDEICPTQFTYDEAMAALTIIAAAGTSKQHIRLVSVLKAAIAPHEFKRAAESHRANEAAKMQELTKLVHKAVSLIPLEDEK